MKILYIAMKYDYGKRNLGYSPQHCSFYDSLVRMGGGNPEPGDWETLK